MTPRKGYHIKPPAERKDRGIMVRLTQAERLALERIAKRHKLPVSHFIREAIRLLIEKEGATT
jgi:hypothetical protein